MIDIDKIDNAKISDMLDEFDMCNAAEKTQLIEGRLEWASDMVLAEEMARRGYMIKTHTPIWQ